LTHKNKVKSFT